MTTEFTDILRNALAVEIPDQVREDCRQRVMAGADQILVRKQARSNRPANRRLQIFKPVALASAMFTLLFAGTAWAATGAEPDDFLYPVKQHLEAARTSIALQNIDRARVQIAHAQTRMDEIDNMASRDRSNYIPALLADYDRLMASATEHLQAAAADGEDISEVQALMTAARTRHDELLRSLTGPGPDTDQPGTNMGTGTTSTMETPDTGMQNDGGNGGMDNGTAPESHSPGDDGSDAGNAGPGSMTPQAPSMEQGGPGSGGSGGSMHPSNMSSPTGMSSQSVSEPEPDSQPAARMTGR
ncbi:MAG: DUF5667 domain-containing protein [Thermoleophilia bacterium]